MGKKQCISTGTYHAAHSGTAESVITEQVDLTFPLIRIPGRLRVDKELKKQPRFDRYPVSWCLYHQVLYRLVAASGLSLINPQTEEEAFTSVAEGGKERQPNYL